MKNIDELGQELLNKKKLENNVTQLYATKNKLTEEELYQKTIESIGSENIIYTKGRFYLWDSSGIWKVADDKWIKQEVLAVMKSNNAKLSNNQLQSTCSLIGIAQFKPKHNFNTAKNRINCLNGELEYRDGEFILQHHSKEHYFTNQIPIKFNPDAKAPNFEKFLREILIAKDEETDESMITLIKEFMGYSLTTLCNYEKFIILIGNGANGKSVLLQIVENLVGRENTVAVQPSQFKNVFQRAHLDGKLINIVTEIAEGAVIADAELKAIVSGDMITAEHKGCDPFEFHPFTTCWFGTNHIPHTRDFSDALQRRAEIINFPNKFEGKNCDPYLKDKLLLELEGIFMIALNALADVYKRGAFTKCESSDAAKLEWRKEADQVVQFIEECCRELPDGKETIGDLYTRYRLWADDSGIHHRLGKNKFSIRLHKLGYGRSLGTGGTRHVNGLLIDKATRN